MSKVTGKCRTFKTNQGVVTLKGWNEKNDKLLPTARKAVGDAGFVNVKYWDGLNVVNSIWLNTATGGFTFIDETEYECV